MKFRGGFFRPERRSRRTQEKGERRTAVKTIGIDIGTTTVSAVVAELVLTDVPEEAACGAAVSACSSLFR